MSSRSLNQATVLCDIQCNTRAEADKNDMTKIICKEKEKQRRNKSIRSTVLIAPGNVVLL
jgi:hypothetical protein